MVSAEKQHRELPIHPGSRLARRESRAARPRLRTQSCTFLAVRSLILGYRGRSIGYQVCDAYGRTEA